MSDSLTLVLFCVIVGIVVIFEYLRREYWSPRKGSEEAVQPLKADGLFPPYYPGREAW